MSARAAALAAKARFFLACRRGASAVEFALVASMLILVIVFVLIVGLILYFSQALDYAAVKASRQIMIGNVQKTSMSQANFQKQVCGFLPAGFDCNNVIVNVYNVSKAASPSGYYAYVSSDASRLLMPATLSNAGATYSPGTQGSYEYVQIIYPITFIPNAFTSMLGASTFNGAPAYLVVSTAAFANEQY